MDSTDVDLVHVIDEDLDDILLKEWIFLIIKVPNSKTQGILTLFHITRFIFFDMYERVLL